MIRRQNFSCTPVKYASRDFGFSLEDLGFTLLFVAKVVLDGSVGSIEVVFFGWRIVKLMNKNG